MSLLDQLLPFPPSLTLNLPEFNQLIQQLAFGNLKHWESASYLLFKSGRIQDFLQLMNVITSKIIDKDHDEGSKQTKIRIYNYLSIYYLIQASKAENNEKAQEQFEVVIKNFNLSDRYDFDGLTFNIKGLFSFYKGDQNQSLEYYKTSLGKILPDEKVSTVFPLIGTAQVYFAIGEYKESLVYFKKVIKLRPNVPGKVRLGMAYCFFQLEQYTLAYYTFLRVLQLEPQNVEAIIGLAVLCYNKGDYDGYFQRLIQAFNINKNNPVILYYLAEHYLFQQQYDRCQKCIKNGLKALDLVSRVQFKEKANELKFRNDWSNLKGRFLYLWGFIKQINGDFESAYKIYNQSKQFNRNNPLVLYALSQIFIHSQYLNYVESNKLLQEKVMKIYENSYFMHEIQRTIAYIYSKCLNDKKMILNAYKKALQYNPDDCETLIEYAQQIDDDATVYYQRAEKILENKQLLHQNQYCFQQQTEQVIFPELYINMGVLQQTLNPQEALKCFKKCEQLLEVFKIPDYVVETNEETTTQEVQLKKNLYQIMLFYNMGIVNEQLGDFVQAEENWKQCIQLNPYFVDAYIRLSYLYFELGNADLALEQLNNGQIQFEQVIQHNKIYKQYNPIPMMYGYISAQTFDDVTTKEQFKANLEDCYSKFCLMAHDYQMAADRNKNTDHSFLKSVLRQLAQSSLKILQYDQKNIQAAMIVILIIAEVGQLQQALSQLENLQEYSNVQPRILSNLAILEYMIGNEENYQPAKLYFKKFYEKTNYKPDEHTDLSVAQMHLNYNNYKDAANTIKRCIINNPSQMRHRLNLYIVIHQQCYEILENPKFKYNLRLLSSAIQYFKILMRSYEYMYRGTCWQSRDQQYRAQLRPYIRQQQFQIIREKCEDRYNYINTYQMNFDRFLRDAQEYEKQQKIKQEQIELERKKRLQEAQQKEQEQQQNIIDEEKAAQLELLQQQFLEQMKRDKELAEEERKQSKGKRLTKQDKKRIEKEKEEEEAFLESEDDESYNSNQALRDEQKMKQDLGDSEEDLKEQEEYEKKGKTPKLKKQKKQQKQNIKQKSRLQKQEDLEDEQIFESKSEEKQDDYDVFN